MAIKETKFDIWWNSPEVKQKVGAAYSLGAAVVIIGAMFKILHLPGAGTMLGIGMTVEALLFSLGVLDKPHHEYKWENVFDFDSKEAAKSIPENKSQAQTSVQPQATSRSVGLNYNESINDDDVKKLSEGIKNLSLTAQHLSSISDISGSASNFVKNIDSASAATNTFVQSQQSLNKATESLSSSYEGIFENMHAVDKNTKVYATRVDDINKNLSAINSIYEIQIKNIQNQSESLTLQTEKVNSVTTDLNTIVSDMQKMKISTSAAATETELFKSGTTKLAKQITDLNQVYGNMLNALS